MISEVYQAVRPNAVLGKNINDPNPDCKIGKQINKQLDLLSKDAEAAMLKKLGNISLADFHRKFS